MKIRAQVRRGSLASRVKRLRSAGGRLPGAPWHSRCDRLELLPLLCCLRGETRKGQMQDLVPRGLCPLPGQALFGQAPPPPRLILKQRREALKQTQLVSAKGEKATQGRKNRLSTNAGGTGPIENKTPKTSHLFKDELKIEDGPNVNLQP